MHKRTYWLRRVTRKHKLLPKKPADTLVAHITVTRDDGPSVADFKADMREVERIGWERFQSGVSYNFCIDFKTGQVGIGQALDAKGTHTINDKDVPGFSYDQNAVALAISFIGMPGDKLTSLAISKTAKLIATLIDCKALTPTFDFVPHSLFAYKDCPTDNVRENMELIKKTALQLRKKP